MNCELYPDGEVTLSTFSTTEIFQPLTDWMSCLEAANAVEGWLYLKTKTGTFQCRLGVQTTGYRGKPSAAVAVGSAPSYVSTVGIDNGKAYRFNPNDATDGDIDAAGVTQFRLGILYVNTSPVTGQGQVAWEGLSWR